MDKTITVVEMVIVPKTLKNIVEQGKTLYRTATKALYIEKPDEIMFPVSILDVLDLYSTNVVIEDLRTSKQLTLNEPYKNSDILDNLYDYQKEAVSKLLKYKNGAILVSPTGTGKTAMALKLIQKLAKTTLIIVPNKTLMYQWKDEIYNKLNYQCGLIGDNNFDIKDITVGIVNSTSKDKVLNEIYNAFSVIIVDECHNAATKMYSKVLCSINAQKRYGLTATLIRKDKLEYVIEYLISPNIIDIYKLMEQVVNVYLVNTHYQLNPLKRYTANLTELSTSPVVNKKIVEVIKTVKDKYTLVFVSRREQTAILKEMLEAENIPSQIIVGGTKERQVKEKIVLCTNVLSEGFDFPKLQAIFFTYPFNNEKLLKQIIGRLTREHKSKSSVSIYDFLYNGMCSDFVPYYSQVNRQEYYVSNNWKLKMFKKSV